MQNSNVTGAQKGTPKRLCPKGLRKRKIHYSARRLSDYTIKLTPSLVLHGVWFQQAGFCIGDVVDVEVGNGKIVISSPLPF